MSVRSISPFSVSSSLKPPSSPERSIIDQSPSLQDQENLPVLTPSGVHSAESIVNRTSDVLQQSKVLSDASSFALTQGDTNRALEIAKMIPNPLRQSSAIGHVSHKLS